MKKIILTIAGIGILFCFSGCFTYDKEVVHFDVKQGLKGTITLTMAGFSSLEKDSEEQKKAMDDFCGEKSVAEMKTSWEKEWGVENAKVEFANRTDTSCDVTYTADFSNIAQPLIGLAQGNNFEIRKINDRFLVKLYLNPQEKPKKEDKKNKKEEIKLDPKVEVRESKEERLFVSITYEGKIIAHNAHQYNNATHAMEWDVKKLHAKPLYFILQE